MFNFEYIDSNSIGNTTKEAETQLMLINDFMLDYEEYSAHVMTWYVTVSYVIRFEEKKMRVKFQDSGNNEASQSVIVNVIDMPDTAPRWTQIFAVEQFDEKTEQVIAKLIFVLCEVATRRKEIFKFLISLLNTNFFIVELQSMLQ